MLVLLPECQGDIIGLAQDNANYIFKSLQTDGKAAKEVYT